MIKATPELEAFLKASGVPIKEITFAQLMAATKVKVEILKKFKNYSS